MQLARTGSPAPRHWIGARKGWESLGGSPLDHLVSLPPADLRTHALVIGATGAGKTNLLHHLIAQDVILGHSFAVLDLRGDLVAAALEILAGRADPRRVALLDLREKERPTGFDPLAGSGEPYFRALGVLDAVASQADSWGVQLAETLRNGLMLLAEAGEPLTRLEALLHDRGFLAACLDRCADAPSAGFWLRYADLSADRRAALATPVLNKVSLLLSTRSLRATFGHPRPIDLRAQLDTPGSATLVSLAADETHGAGRMAGKIVLASLCREVFARVGVPESRRNPVRLYVDEFEHFGEAEFETVLAEGRRFGLSLVLAHQTLAQLVPRTRSMILGNVGAKVAFRCGREDAATISKDLTGDPKALDLAALGTGEAVLWTRSGGTVPVEVNMPIVGDVGRVSASASGLRRAVLERNGRAAPERPMPAEPARLPERDLPPAQSRPVPARAAGRQPAPRPTPRPATPEALEDWLCG